MRYYKRLLYLDWADKIDRMYCENISTGTYTWLYFPTGYFYMSFSSQLVDLSKETKVKRWEI